MKQKIKRKSKGSMTFPEINTMFGLSNAYMSCLHEVFWRYVRRFDNTVDGYRSLVQYKANLMQQLADIVDLFRNRDLSDGSGTAEYRLAKYIHSHGFGLDGNKIINIDPNKLKSKDTVKFGSRIYNLSKTYAVSVSGRKTIRRIIRVFDKCEAMGEID